MSTIVWVHSHMLRALPSTLRNTPAAYSPTHGELGCARSFRARLRALAVVERFAAVKARARVVVEVRLREGKFVTLASCVSSANPRCARTAFTMPGVPAAFGTHV